MQSRSCHDPINATPPHTLVAVGLHRRRRGVSCGAPSRRPGPGYGPCGDGRRCRRRAAGQRARPLWLEVKQLLNGGGVGGGLLV
jgi:hypothetical protein